MLNTESLRKPAINYITKRTRKRSLPRGKSDTRRTRRGNYPKRKNILNSDCLLEERILREKKEKNNYERNCVIRAQNGENYQKRINKAPEAQLKLTELGIIKLQLKFTRKDHSSSCTRYPRGGGGYSKKFYTGKLRPEVQPLTLLFTIFFFRKGTSFVYLLLEKGTPFIYLMNISLKQEVFLSLFSRSA